MNIGIVVNNLGLSQLSYEVTRNINDLLRQTSEHCITIFYENMKHMMSAPMCATLHSSNCWSFNHPLVATSLSTANKILSVPYNGKKFLYCWNLEWLNNIPHYEPIQRIYTHPDLTLITRNEQHAKILENCFNVKPAFNMQEFDINTLLERL